MSKFAYILLFVALSVSFPAFAQNSADDYFHATANLYINGAKSEAKRLMREAIEKFPNNEKLQKMSAAVDGLPDEDSDDKKNKQQQQNQPQMSKEQAQQLLQALEQDEKETQEKAKQQQVKGKRSAEKNW
ncbi:MAG: hypothetical protein LBN23_02370 [Paludibacter sp.]|jgi:hypothetical protein|nr:hypothetical protein [Paludibacter sp.]